MSDAIQLELNIDDKTPEEMQISLMQRQINELADSMGKVRRKLFSELGEMKKTCAVLEKENQDLKSVLQEIKYGKTEWTYAQGGNLFDIRQYQNAVG